MKLSEQMRKRIDYFHHRADVNAETFAMWCDEVAQLEADIEELKTCPFCKSYATKPPSSDPDVGWLRMLHITSPLKKLEAEMERLRLRADNFEQELREQNDAWPPDEVDEWIEKLALKAGDDDDLA